MSEPKVVEKPAPISTSASPVPKADTSAGKTPTSAASPGSKADEDEAAGEKD